MNLRQAAAPLGALMLLTGCTVNRYVEVPLYGGSYPHAYGNRYGVPPPLRPVIVTPVPFAWSNPPSEPDIVEPPPSRHADRSRLVDPPPPRGRDAATTPPLSSPLPSWSGSSAGGDTTTTSTPIEPPPRRVLPPPEPPAESTFHVLPPAPVATVQVMPPPRPLEPLPEVAPSGLPRLGSF